MHSAQKQYASHTSHKESYLGFEIYIDSNPDPYREGFMWTVCRDGEELDGELEFGFSYALKAARSAVHDFCRESHALSNLQV